MASAAPSQDLAAEVALWELMRHNLGEENSGASMSKQYCTTEPEHLEASGSQVRLRIAMQSSHRLHFQNRYDHGTPLTSQRPGVAAANTSANAAARQHAHAARRSASDQGQVDFEASQRPKGIARQEGP